MSLRMLCPVFGSWPCVFASLQRLRGCRIPPNQPLCAGASDNSQLQAARESQVGWQRNGWEACCFDVKPDGVSAVFCFEISGFAQIQETQEEGNHKQMKTYPTNKGFAQASLRKVWKEPYPRACPLEPHWDPERRSRAMSEDTQTVGDLQTQLLRQMGKETGTQNRIMLYRRCFSLK